jgi:hypothetical protein
MTRAEKLGLAAVWLFIAAAAYIAYAPLHSSAQSGVAIQPFTYPDITGAASTTQLSTTLGCASVQMIAPAANSASVRWGDASTSATRGGVIAAGGGQYLPPNGSNYYPLASLYVYVGSGDKLQFVCFR